MIEAADKKRELIVEKALLRFSHFGINKTTMNEIAEDLAISKPSLYYYFPDKISLAIAVTERIFNDFFKRLEKILEETGSVKQALFSTIDLRGEFYEKYFMLRLRDTPRELFIHNEDFKKLLEGTRKREGDLLKLLFIKGLESKELKNPRSEEASELYLESIIGLGMCVMSKQEKQLVPESKGFEEVLNKQKALTEIFLSGLKN